MMDVAIALLIVASVATLGGIGHGVITYGGAVFPQKETGTVKVGPPNEQKDIEVTTWLPGIIGEAFVGLLSGLLVFCVYVEPTKVVAINSTIELTFYSLGTILLAGLAGTTAINELIEKRNWSKLAPVLGQSDPTKQPAAVTGGKPQEALRMLST